MKNQLLVNASYLILIKLIACNSISKQTMTIPFKQTILENTVARHPEVEDIDDDGKNDLIIVTDYVDENGRDQENIKHITLYHAPDWEKHILVSLNYRADDMDLADMDGDNDLDIVGRAAKSAGEDEKNAMNFWLENPGPKGYPVKDEWKRHNIGRCEYVKDLEVADFNGDNKPDYVARTHSHIYIWFQENFDSWKLRDFVIHPHEGMRIGDLDNDGDPDIVLNGYWLETPDDPLKDEWVEHNFDEKWWTQNTGEWMDNACRIFIADMNKDGRKDVVLSHSEMPGYPVSWYEAPNDPKKDTWIEHVIGQVDYCHTALVGDMDNDGDFDVVAGELIHGTDPNPDSPHPVVVFINDGDAMSWRMQELSTDGVYAAEMGDLGDDGDLDIIGSRNFRNPPLNIWENETSDRLSSKLLFNHTIIEDDPELSHAMVGIADLSGDGRIDILTFSHGEGGAMSWYEYPNYERHIIKKGPVHADQLE